MSRIFAAFALAAALLLAAPAANAAVQDFGAFTVDVPDGWTAEKDDTGCTITKNDQSGSVGIMHMKDEGITAKQYADGIAEKFTNPEMETNSDGVIIIRGKIGDVPTVTAVGVSRGTAVIMTMSSMSQENFAVMGKICGSVKSK